MSNILIKLLIGAAGTILLQIVSQLVERRVFDKVLDVARAEVRRLEGDKSKDSEAKRKAAEEAVVQELRAIGVVTGKSLINLAIELAVVEQKLS